MPAFSGFNANDVVRLLDRHGDVPSGAVGRIVGVFPHSTARSDLDSYAVEGCVADVRFDEMVVADDVRASV
jgi:hypothetical protein